MYMYAVTSNSNNIIIHVLSTLSYTTCVGVSIDEAENNFFNEYKVRLPEHFFKEQIEGSMDLFRSRLEPLMVNTVTRLHQRGALQCIASGSPRPRVDLCVQVAGMDPFFTPDRVFTRELVRRGKPAPDLFLYTADKVVCVCVHIYVCVWVCVYVCVCVCSYIVVQ